MQSPVQTVIKH